MRHEMMWTTELIASGREIEGGWLVAGALEGDDKR